MRYQYDAYGWYVGEVDSDSAPNSSSIAPPTGIPEGHRANYVGNEWVVMEYVAPRPVPTITLPPDPRLKWVDVGPFKDRMNGGMDAMAIGASGHPACLGVKEMLNGRLYVDLDDPKVESMLDLLIATEQPAANPMFPGSGPMTVEKKLAILKTPTVDRERYVKGLP